MKIFMAVAIFVAGFVFGLAIDAIPIIFTNFSNVTLCAEGCAHWKKEIIFPVTIGMPFLWGIVALLLARRRQQQKSARNLFWLILLISVATMFALIWITKIN
jgi:hypothetical protein